MEECIKKLIDETNKDIQRLEDEIKELSCEVNPHPDDVILCQKLAIKLDCNKRFVTKLYGCWLKKEPKD
jgi:hypothetical protein